MTASRAIHSRHSRSATALLALLIAALPAAVHAQAAAPAPAPAISKADYLAGKKDNAAQTRTALAACQSQTGAARSACITRANNQDKIAGAELETRYKPGKASTARLDAARARADKDNARLDAEAKAAAAAPTSQAAASAKTPATGGNAVRAGQSAHVGADGRVRVGNNASDLPAPAASLRAKKELDSTKMPSNKPVDVGAAAKAAKEGAR